MMDYYHHTCDSTSLINMCKFILLTIIMFHVMRCMSFSYKKIVCKSCKAYSHNDL